MPLEAWLTTIEDVAPGLLGPSDRRGEALAAEVRALSELYTRRRDALPEAGEALAARLRFFLPRDLPKVWGPLEELGDALPRADTWRVLDLGAGLGTTTLGLASWVHRSLAASAGRTRALHVTAYERDAASIDAFESLTRAAREADLIGDVTLEARTADLSTLDPARLPKADLILVGLALNELFDGDHLDDAEAWLRALVGRLTEGGALIVLEPALRETSRALQRLRDRLTEHVYAPCLRAGDCPLLRRERDWCHAQRDGELPERLATIAKAAGLRWSRPTYAYLTLRADGARLGGFGDRRALRIVGGPVATKGKTEWDGCGAAGLVRLRRLDRERGPSNEALDDARRGTRLRLAQAPADGASVRLRPSVAIERI